MSPTLALTCHSSYGNNAAARRGQRVLGTQPRHDHILQADMGRGQGAAREDQGRAL